MTDSTNSADRNANKLRGTLAEDASAWFVRSWNSRRREHLRILRKCRQRLSQNNIHDIRVSVRRLLAHLEVLRGSSIPSLEKKRKRLKRILCITDALRDAHVQVQLLDHIAQRHPHIGLKLLRQHLEKRARRLKSAIAKKLKRQQPKLAHLRIGKRLDQMVTTTDGKKRFQAMSDRALRSRMRKARLRLRYAWTGAAFPEHRARVAVKKLRYLAEVIIPPTAQAEKAFKQLHAIQSVLGDLHDFDIFLQGLEKSARRNKRIAAWLRIQRPVLHRRRWKMVAACPALKIRLSDLRRPK